MLTPSWDPVIGTLGGVLDPKVIISRLNTEWRQHQGPISNDKDTNVVFQTSNKSHLKCDNCGRPGHFKAKCWAKGGGQEGQYPEWFKGKRDSHTTNTIKTVSENPIVWTCGSISKPDVWIADSAATVHVSCNCDNFTSYQKYDECQDIKAFSNNTVKGVGEGDIMADVEFEGKTTRICLTQVMHVPGADGKILSLKKLDQKGFEIHIIGGHISIMKANEVYAKASLGSDLYKVKMK